MRSLKSFIIENSCFYYVRKAVVEELPNLTSLSGDFRGELPEDYDYAESFVEYPNELVLRSTFHTKYQRRFAFS